MMRRIIWRLDERASNSNLHLLLSTAPESYPSIIVPNPFLVLLNLFSGGGGRLQPKAGAVVATPSSGADSAQRQKSAGVGVREND